MTVLNELLLITKDLERLKQHGEEIVEEFQEGPFTLILTKNIHHNTYQVGLTSDEQEFTSPESQTKKLTNQSTRTIIQSWGRISRKIKEWLERFGMIHIGSMNKSKTHKYHRILSNFGLDCGPIQSIGRGDFFIIKP